jgi:kynureninase
MAASAQTPNPPDEPAVPDERDEREPFARLRAEFHRPEGRIYLDGNSLGLLSRRAEASLQRAVETWKRDAIDGWTSGPDRWIDLAERMAARLSPLLGAAPATLALRGQTTENLHQLLATLYDPTHPTRRVILADALNFASDTYALQSHLRLRGQDPTATLRLIPSRDGRCLWLEDILSHLTDDVQILVLPSVIFTSGQLLDLATITRKARERGIIVGWDLAHSIGVVPHALDRDGVDFAFWCHYKWLNAGPGAVGGLYLNERYFGRPPGLAGWWGVRPERRFEMRPEHLPAAGAAALHVGTPAILALAPLEGSLELIAEAGGIGVLRERSLALTQALLAAVDEELVPLGFKVATPRGAAARGGHIALAHPDAWRLCQALKAHGVVPDFRAPDLLRLAPSPLYTRFADVREAVRRLRIIAETGAQRAMAGEVPLVP